MPTAENVRVGVPDSAGGIYVAAIGTTLPTTPTGALAAAFLAGNLGYISEDGVTQAIGADTTDIRSWEGDIVRKVQTTHDVTFAFTMIETESKSLQLYYGNFAAGTVEMTSEQPGKNSFVLQINDGGNKIRVVIPSGQITERGDVVYKLDEPVAFPVTVTAYPDGVGVKAYKYLAGSGS